MLLSHLTLSFAGLPPRHVKGQPTSLTNRLMFVMLSMLLLLLLLLSYYYNVILRDHSNTGPTGSSGPTISRMQQGGSSRTS
jgi:hypothetical protein